MSAAVYFETQVASFAEYGRSLDELAKLHQIVPSVGFMGALVLRSQAVHEHSGYLQSCCSSEPMEILQEGEWSSGFKYPPGVMVGKDGNEYAYGRFGCLWWASNNFAYFVFDFLQYLKGIESAIPSRYGTAAEGGRVSRLFH